MKRNSIIVSLLLALCTTTALVAQDAAIVRDNDSNVLMRVNDEGNFGSITVPPTITAPATILNKLYNVNGTLFFNGVDLTQTGGGSLWSLNGNDIFYNNGNVGIGGLPIPLTGLTVRNNAGNAHILDLRSTLGIGRFRMDDNGNAGFGPVSNVIGLSVRNPSSLNSTAFQVASFDGTSRFQVDDNGNVGLNTTNPNFPLHVVAGTQQGIKIQQGTGDLQQIRWTDTADNLRAAISVNNAFPRMHLNVNGTDRISINGDGHVGIGQQPNKTVLTVRDLPSSLFIFDLVSVGGDLLFRVHPTGRIQAPSLPFGDHFNMQYQVGLGEFFYDNSSRRYKRNIQPLEDDFSLILKAQPKTYTRPDYPDRWEVGYIAEEMDSLGLTKLMSYDAEGIPNGFNYEKMILYVNEILKTHRDDLEAKEQAIAELEQNLQQVQQEMAALKAALLSSGVLKESQ